MAKTVDDASQKLDNRIAELNDWRGELLGKLWVIIEQADPDITLEWKWATAVWTQHGLVCAIGAFKDHVKLNFFQGANLADPQQLFNSGFDSKLHRAIDFYAGDTIKEQPLKELVRSAIAYNHKK